MSLAYCTQNNMCFLQSADMVADVGVKTPFELLESLCKYHRQPADVVLCQPACLAPVGALCSVHVLLLFELLAACDILLLDGGHSCACVQLPGVYTDRRVCGHMRCATRSM